MEFQLGAIVLREVASVLAASASNNSTGPSGNSTDTGDDGSGLIIQKCKWGYVWNDNWECESLFNFVPGGKNMWKLYGTFFPIIYFMFTILYAYASFRHVRTYVSKRPMIFSAQTWLLFGTCFASLCMGISCIDGWAFFGILTLKAYLIILCLGYGTLPACTMILPAVDYMDNRLQKSRSKVSTGYSIGALAVMILAALLSIVGYGVFGIFLAGRLEENASSPWGRTASILVYVMYGMSMIAIVCTIPYFVTRLWEDCNYHSGQGVVLTLFTNQTISWAVVCFLASAFNISQMIQRNELSDKSIYDTFNQLTWTRLAEIAIMYRTLAMVDSMYCERMPFEMWTRPFVTFVLGARWLPSMLASELERFTRMTEAETASSTTEGGGGGGGGSSGVLTVTDDGNGGGTFDTVRSNRSAAAEAAANFKLPAFLTPKMLETMLRLEQIVVASHEKKRAQREAQRGASRGGGYSRTKSAFGSHPGGTTSTGSAYLETYEEEDDDDDDDDDSEVTSSSSKSSSKGTAVDEHGANDDAQKDDNDNDDDEVPEVEDPSIVETAKSPV